MPPATGSRLRRQRRPNGGMVHGKVKTQDGTLQRFNGFQPLTSRDKGETTGLKFTFMHMLSNRESEGCIERSNRNYQP